MRGSPTFTARRRAVFAGVRRAIEGAWARGLVGSIAMAIFAASGQAQTAGQVDPSFGASLGLSDHVTGMVLQPNGKVVVCGTFPQGIVRLNSDGNIDPTFLPTGTGYSGLDSIASGPDGKVYLLCAQMPEEDGPTYHPFFLLDSDGSVDPSFTAQLTATLFAVASNGQLVCAAEISSSSDGFPDAFFRLNPNGSRDADFQPAVDPFVSAVCSQPDGKVLVAVIDGLYRLNPDGSLDPNFTVTAITGIDGLVRQADGGIIAYGFFTEVEGTAHNGLARFNPNGMLDNTFNANKGADGTINAVSFQSDQKIIVAGQFTEVDGVSRQGIARLMQDGSLDHTFNPGTGVNGDVFAVAVQPNGEILIAGVFDTVNGQSRNGVARLSASGEVSDDFLADAAKGPNNQVESIAAGANGKVLISGEFTGVDGLIRRGTAQLNRDGSVDKGFIPDSTITGNAFAPYSASGETESGVAGGVDGAVAAVVQIEWADGNATTAAVLLSASGSIVGSYVPPASATYAELEGSYFLPDGSVVFIQSTLDKKSELVRLGENGTLDPAYDPTTSMGNITDVFAQLNDEVLIAGEFGKVDGTADFGVARLKADGTLDSSLDLGSVSVKAVDAEGRILTIQQDDLDASYSVVRLEVDGTPDPTFNSTVETPIQTVFAQSDGNILVQENSLVYNPDDLDMPDTGGQVNFHRLNSDGSLGMAFSCTTDAGLQSVAVQADGKILLGGHFTHVNGVVRNYVARLNTDGTLDQTFQAGGSAEVNALVQQPDDLKIVIAGDFAKVGETQINALARLNPTDGSTDTTFAPGFAAGVTAQAVALDSDGNTLVATLETDTDAGADSPAIDGHGRRVAGRRGPQTQAQVRNPIHRCSKLNGQVDETFVAETESATGGNGTTLALAGLPGRLTLIGGSFATVNGSAHANLARLGSDGSLEATFVGVTDGTVRGLDASAANGTILAAGDFTQVDGVTRARIARLQANGTVDGSFDPGVGPNGSVYAVRLLGNNQVLIAGNFTAVDGQGRDGLAQLNADGTLDSSFAPPEAYVLSRTPGGAGGLTRQSQVIQGTGSTPPTFTSLDIQPADQKIVVGGLFKIKANSGSATRNNVARINPDGSLDASFDTGDGPDAMVNDLRLQPDGRALLGGAFGTVEGLQRSGAARLFGDPATVTVAAVHEGASVPAVGKAKFIVTRAGGDMTAALRVNFVLRGTAKAGVDYLETPNSVKIAAQQKSAVVKVHLISTGAEEAAQSVLKLKITSGAGYDFETATRQATVTIARER